MLIRIIDAIKQNPAITGPNEAHGRFGYSEIVKESQMGNISPDRQDRRPYTMDAEDKCGKTCGVQYVSSI